MVSKMHGATINIFMFSAVRQVTKYVPTTGLLEHIW